MKRMRKSKAMLTPLAQPQGWNIKDADSFSFAAANDNEWRKAA